MLSDCRHCTVNSRHRAVAGDAGEASGRRPIGTLIPDHSARPRVQQYEPAATMVVL